MLTLFALITLAAHTPGTPPAAPQASLLRVVPEDAYVLAHCRDVAGLRARAEANDWYRLLGSSHGSPLVDDVARDLARASHSDVDALIDVARALEGEVVLFDTGSVAGFATSPPADRSALLAALHRWLPAGEDAVRQTLEIAGGRVELVAWPDQIDGWTGRAGHFAALVEHPAALAVYSGDDAEAVTTAIRAGLAGLAVERHAPLVTAYLQQGGGAGRALELFVDFTPLVAEAEAALARSVQDVLPDPAGLLGLEQGTWLHLSADLMPGTAIDCRANLHIPPGTLAARLADTWKPLRGTLPAELPANTWGVEAWNWDIAGFYAQAREAYEAAGLGEGLAGVDAGIEGARGLTGVDPIADVLQQLRGDCALFWTDRGAPADDERPRDMEGLLSIGFQAGLLDGEAFLDAFEQLIGVGGLDSVLEFDTFEGVEVYLFGEEDDDDVNGGLAFLPRTFVAAPARSVLQQSVRAHTGAEGASLLSGSPMAAVIDENAGACFLLCLELSPLRAFLPAEWSEGLSLPPLREGEPARDPFDSRLISSARRTPQGFELWLRTR